NGYPAHHPPMKGDSLHSLELSPRITEDLGGRAPRVRVYIHFRIPPLGFFRPKPSVLHFGEILQALEQLPCQTSPCFRIESQCFGLEFLNTHGDILHQTGLLKHGEPIRRRSEERRVGKEGRYRQRTEQS